jgi:hypothetical protein
LEHVLDLIPLLDWLNFLFGNLDSHVLTSNLFTLFLLLSLHLGHNLLEHFLKLESKLRLRLIFSLHPQQDLSFCHGSFAALVFLNWLLRSSPKVFMSFSDAHQDAFLFLQGLLQLLHPCQLPTVDTYFQEELSYE